MLSNVHDSFLDLKHLKTSCLMGFANKERVERQTIETDLRLYVDTKKCVQTGKLEDSIDYVRVLAEVRFILEHSHFFLIESAGEAIASYLLSDHPSGYTKGVLKAVTVQIRKPDVVIYGASPELTLHREKTQLPIPVATVSPGVTKEVVFLSPEVQLYRISVAPKTFLSVRDLASDEFFLTSGLKLGKRELSAGEVCRWKATESRTYENLTEAPQTFLWITHCDPLLLGKKLVTEKFVNDPEAVEDFYMGIPQNYVDNHPST